MGDDQRTAGARLVGGLAETAARLRGLPPSCGAVTLVAVDGYAGSGKTTFTERLAARLGGAPVVHLDDLATHEALFGWLPRLEAEVLRPLASGREGRHRVYDWTARRFLGERADRTVPVADVVLIEGVGAARGALRPCLARILWMDVPREVAHARGEARDGPALAAFWRKWERAEREHFAADPSKPFAELLVRAVSDGYEVREKTPEGY